MIYFSFCACCLGAPLYSALQEAKLNGQQHSSEKACHFGFEAGRRQHLKKPSCHITYTHSPIWKTRGRCFQLASWLSRPHNLEFVRSFVCWVTEWKHSFLCMFCLCDFVWVPIMFWGAWFNQSFTLEWRKKSFLCIAFICVTLLILISVKCKSNVPWQKKDIYVCVCVFLKKLCEFLSLDSIVPWKMGKKQVYLENRKCTNLFHLFSLWKIDLFQRYITINTCCTWLPWTLSPH
jgi:hypothetical protein